MKRLIGIVIMAGMCAFLLSRSLDGFTGLLGGLLGHEDTVYASGYSDRSFRSIDSGMTRDQVHETIGLPLVVWTNQGALVEQWSRSPSDTDYRRRLIYFRNDRVTKKIAEYYFD